MSPQLPHHRIESGPSCSGSSSVESLQRGTPDTPPHVKLNLDPVAISDATGFSDFFPWIKHKEVPASVSQGQHSTTAIDDTVVAHNHGPSTCHKNDDTIAAFQQREAVHLPRQSLLPLSVLEADQPSTSLDLLHDSLQMQTAMSEQIPRPVDTMSVPTDHTKAGLPTDRTSTCSPEFNIASEHGPRMSGIEPWGQVLSSEELRRLRTCSPHHVEAASSAASAASVTSGVFRRSCPSMPTTAFPSPAPPHPHFSPRSCTAQLSQTGDMEQPAASGSQVNSQASRTDLRADSEILDIFEDEKLPGYLVWRRGFTSSSAMVVRIPRQMVGWKAVLMNAGGFVDAAFSSGATCKKERRASKVLGKQGWEVRQEALKNSYDFRRGSGIWATMHAGHRLFKHDWHVIVKDGARYMWRMEKTALALYREDVDVKIAEFRKAVPSSSATVQPRELSEGYAPDDRKRIGSFRFDKQALASTGLEQTSAIFGMDLALASLVVVFKARGGHQNISAAFEPSSHPFRRVLEQRRQETPDREEVMLALPRPGFARDTESILSDTTDEDADPRTSDTLSPRRAPPPSQSPDLRPPNTLMRSRHMSTVNAAPHAAGGRTRLSSLFSRNSTPAELDYDDELKTNDRSMTDSQRIARQYRTQSMLLSR